MIILKSERPFLLIIILLLRRSAVLLHIIIIIIKFMIEIELGLDDDGRYC